jgi:AraC-like DNA-binding protein
VNAAPLSGGQRHVERAPVPVLRGLVASVWVQQVDADAAPYAHRHVPSGSVELVCRVGAAPRVIGPLTAPSVEVLEPGATVVGLRFVPGAFAALAGRPASELRGGALDAEELWGDGAAALGEAVADAASPREALAVLQRRVHERARAGASPDLLVSAVVRGLMPGRRTDVTSVRAALHVSESQLRRRCLTAVGLAPKTLHRMLRFQGFLALVQRSIAEGGRPTGATLAQWALRLGYADQPHLTRECVKLTGVTPRVLLAQTRQTCACGHDHSASFAPLLRVGRGGPGIGSGASTQGVSEHG